MLSCLHKSTTAKAEESDADGIFQVFLADLLATVNLPEWPASAVLLQGLINACIQLVRTAEKGDKQEIALRSSCLKLLGDIGPALRVTLNEESKLTLFGPLVKVWRLWLPLVLLMFAARSGQGRCALCVRQGRRRGFYAGLRLLSRVVPWRLCWRLHNAGGGAEGLVRPYVTQPL